jgi:exonuclease SbcC
VNIKNSFSTLVKKIIAVGVERSLLVIVGDVFESKSYLQMDDIYQWKAMCHLLRKENIKTLVIPGNHDYNINSETVRDNITVLTDSVTYPNIVCLNETCIFSGKVFGSPNIDFYVFSPIDKLIPKVLNDNNIKIALLHEGINAAKYDNGETITNERFRPSDLAEYDYVMLGDIHLHQYLSERIAYCGSFVQKTKGEGINKGYILWDLKNGTSKFCPILLKEVYIKIMADGDKCEMPELAIKQVVRHTSLFHKNCSSKYITELKKTITSKYKYLNRIVDKNNKVIDLEEPSNIVVPNTIDRSIDHTQIIKDILKDDIRLPDILKHHGDILNNRNDVTFTTYKLNYLYWSNIYCYGEDNFINFDDFHNNLVMLNGKNKDGKSSIIDIIIRVLYNECERGLKEDVVNKSKQHGFIKISFNVGPDEYIIEQIYSRTSKAQHHKLYKNGANITQDTIINTYLYIRNVIGLGDYKDFVNMTTAMQNRKFLVDMAQKDFITLLTKITNVDVLKDVEDDTKKEITSLKSQNKKYSNQINTIAEIKESDLVDIKNKKEGLATKRDELYSNINTINKKLILLNKDYNNINIPENLDELIEANNAELKTIESTCNLNETDKSTSKDRLTKITLELSNANERLDQIPTKIIDVINKTDYTIKLKESPYKDLTYKELIVNVKELRDATFKPSNKSIRDLDVLQKIISTYKKEEFMPIEAIDGVIPNDIRQLYTSEEDEDLLNKGLPDYKEILKEIDVLETNIKSFGKNFEALVFDDSCDSCADNRNTIRGIFDIKHESAKLQRLKMIYDDRNTLKIKYEKAKQYKIDKMYNTIAEKNKIAKISNDIITSRLDNYNKANLELKEALNKQQWAELVLMEKQINTFKEFDIQKLYKRRAELLTSKRYLELKSTQLKLLEWDKIRKSNGSKITNINRLNDLEVLAKKELDMTNKNLAEATDKYHNLHSLFNKRKELVEAFEESAERIEFLSLYYSVINCKTGIPSYVLKQTCRSVENNCNEILQKITDFTIEIVYDKDVRIYTVENDIRVSAQLASGMQKFVLDLIFRITLTNISSISSSRTLFVDEGFGALDRDNFIAIAEMLQKLKGNFDSLIIISHIIELRSYVDISINIEKHDYTSFVQYGVLTDAQKRVNLADETSSNSKRVSDFKTGTKTKIAKTAKTTNTTGAKDAAIQEYLCNNDIKDVLFERTGDKITGEAAKITCLGCKKEFIYKANFIEKHIVATTYTQKHNNFILNLIEQEKSLN